MKRFAIGIFALAAIAASTHPGLGQARSEAEERIREGVEAGGRRLLEALEAGEAAAMADCYTPDAALYPLLGPVVRGRDEIERHAQHLIDTGIKSFRIEADEIVGAGDEVVEIGTRTFWNAAGQEVAKVRFLTVWKQVDGLWRIHRDMTTI
jgi:uncharacterized protein (TIGR02246 family)